MPDGPVHKEFIKIPEIFGPKPMVVFCGDSITRGEYSYNWVKHVRDIFRGKVDVYNEGYNSFTVENYIKLKAENIVNKYKNATDIIVGLGTNCSNAEGRHPNNPKYNTQNFKENYIKLIKYFQEKLPNAKIAITTIPNISEDTTHPAYKLGLKYNEIIKEVAAETNVELLPAFELIQNEYKGEYQNDKLGLANLKELDKVNKQEDKGQLYSELGSISSEKFTNDFNLLKTKNPEIPESEIIKLLVNSYIPKEESKEIKQKFKHTMFGEVASMTKNIILHKLGWDYEKIARSGGYKKKVDELHLNKSAKVFAACATWFIKKNHPSIQTS